MQSSEIRLIVPRGLKVLLEGVSRAVVENNPDDITEYFALYFQELVAFRKGLFHRMPDVKSYLSAVLLQLNFCIRFQDIQTWILQNWLKSSRPVVVR